MGRRERFLSFVCKFGGEGMGRLGKKE